MSQEFFFCNTFPENVLAGISPTWFLENYFKTLARTFLIENVMFSKRTSFLSTDFNIFVFSDQIFQNEEKKFCGYRLMVDYLPSKQEIWVRFPLSAINSLENFEKSSLGEMVNTADLKSAPLRVIGSIPIVSM